MGKKSPHCDLAPTTLGRKDESGHCTDQCSRGSVDRRFSNGLKATPRGLFCLLLFNGCCTGSANRRNAIRHRQRPVNHLVDRVGASRSRLELGRFGTANPHFLIAMIILASFGALVAGCTRAHYRKQADAVVSDVISGATANPRFQLPGLNINVDPRSRLYDSTDADFPPMPPDDPDSHRLMECVAGHRGWKHWEKDGVLDDVEVTDFRSSLPYDTDGKVRVDLKGALELARLHSRDYQLQLETMYLSALDVTASRFAFNFQFYGGNSTQYLGLGSLMNGGTRSNTLTTTDNLQINRAFVTGGTLITGIANSIVWQFGGGQSTVNSSLLNFALSQPLLQYAGRPRIMEVLTRSERGLLGNLRQFERYRQGFYLNVATGSGGSNSVVRIGGLSGGSGLTSFSGVGVGGFGGIGAISNFSSGAGVGGAQIAPGGQAGFWYLLQNRQLLRNLRARNSRLRDTWLQLSAAFDAGRLDNRFQVDFARQAYYIGQSMLLSATTAYANFFDQYKVGTLGLPPDIPMDVDDHLFDQFNLIDPELTRLQDEIGDRLQSLSSAHVEGTPLDSADAVHDLTSRVQSFIVEVTKDLKVVDEVWPRRRQALLDLAEFPELKESHFDNRALTPEVMEERVAVLRREFPRVSEDLVHWARKFDQLESDTELETADRVRAEREVLSQVSTFLLELSLLQARARLHGISTTPVRLTSETALQIALCHRADWMNAKASLVDSWRLIRYNANALRSNLTVNISGDLGTTGNNPIKFSGTNGQLAAGVTFDPPLTRVIERNLFRESLIEYQQTRRQLMLARDQIHQGLRSYLRQLRLDQLNLELRRLAVDVAITQTDVARLKLVEPEKPVTDSKTTTTPPPTLARDLVDALGNLLDTQQALIFVWGDYESQRRQLDFNMGTMRLDDDGMWIDPGPMTDEMMIARYYETFPNPLDPANAGDYTNEAELSPTELPPEPTAAELPSPMDQPSSK